MATVKEFRMSQERYDELKKELDYSKTTRADEIAELIKEARGFGDLSENSEYDEAKNEQGKLYSRIAELEEILLHAVIVDESEMTPTKSPSAAVWWSPIWITANSCRNTPSWAPRRPTSWSARCPRIPPSARP